MLTPEALVATWPDGWTVHRLDVPIPVPRAVGRWLIARRLYADGNDFTSEQAQLNPNYRGTSLLKKIWSGVLGSPTEGAEGVRLWVLSRHGKAQGVVVWLHRDAPDVTPPLAWVENVPANSAHKPKQRIATAHLGHVMAFLSAPCRGQGLVRRTVHDFVAPMLLPLAHQARKQGAMAVVAAEDAAASLVAGQTPVPVVTYARPCLAFRREVWNYWRVVQMYPERRHPHSAFAVPPEPIPPPPRVRRRKTMA